MKGKLTKEQRNLQYYKFSAYGFLKDLRFFEPFMLLMFLDKGLSYLEIGSLYALREICINLAEIPSGIIADAMGRRRTMVFSFGGYIVSFLAFFFAQDYGSLALAMVVFALGDAFRTGTHKAMIFDYLKLQGWQDLKTLYYGHTRSWSQTGAAISSLIAAGLVIWQGNYQTVFLFSIIPYLLDQALIISYPKNLDGPRHSERKSLAKEFTHVWKAFVISFKDLFVLRAIGNQALFTGYYKAVKDYLQPLLKAFALGLPLLASLGEKNRSAVLIGVVYTIIYLITAQASRSAGAFSQRFSTLATPLNLTLLVGLGFGLTSGIAQANGLMVLAVLGYMGIFITENLRKPMGIAYVTELMNQDALATALSAESQAETLSAGLIALLLGFMADRFGPGIGLALGSGICILVALLLQLPKVRPGNP